MTNKVLDHEIHCRCDEDFKAWVMAAAFKLDMGRSDFMREALLKGYAVLKAEREARDLDNNNPYPL